MVPWLLLGLLVLGSALGVGFGISQQPTPTTALTLMSRIIRATRAGVSARFIYTDVTKSTNPLLRSDTFGVGTVNFTADAMRTTQVERATDVNTTDHSSPRPSTQSTVDNDIWIKNTEYVRLPITAHVLGSPWTKGATFPSGSFGLLGVLGTMSPLGALEADASLSGLKVENRGRAAVHGIETTSYLLVAPSCRSLSRHASVSTVASPLQIWVDGHDRLVQVQNMIELTIPSGGWPSLLGVVERSFAGRAHTFSTIRLFDYGRPVSITAPALLPRSGSNSTGFALLAHRSCSV
jgi:hypothetical protein